MKKGFTLIELLVVVIIIGILAAIALPQYQIAVTKAKIAKYLPLLKAIANAEDMYFLINGSFTEDINKLDLSNNCPNNRCYFGDDFIATNLVNGNVLVYLKTNDDPSIFTWLTIGIVVDPTAGYAAQLNLKKGQMFCVYRNNPKYLKVCQSFNPSGYSDSAYWIFK